MPRACPVEFSRLKLHSSERDPPRDKPVASDLARWKDWCSGHRENSTGQAHGIFDSAASLFPTSLELRLTSFHATNRTFNHAVHCCERKTTFVSARDRRKSNRRGLWIAAE